MRSYHLYRDVLAAYERACREGDLGVAEYLFRALEIIAEREGNDELMQPAYEIFRDVVHDGSASALHRMPRKT